VTIANEDQHDHWNTGDDVQHWVKHRDRYNVMLAPFGDMILDAARLQPGDGVLDVGCGCGDTTLAAARTVASGRAIGIDLSAPMLAEARREAARTGVTNVEFVEGDAQVHPFDQGGVDVVISRFGIMFFADPVAAFANIRAAVRSGGRMAFVCWQDRGENEWLRVPAAALAQHVTLPAAPQPGAAGMLAFADPTRCASVLSDAGWGDVEVASVHAPIAVGGGRGLDDAVEFFRTGAIGRAALATVDPATAARAVDAVRTALEDHVTDEGVRLDAAVWVVTASA
jgi:SAM-dependent methyltransferase